MMTEAKCKKLRAVTQERLETLQRATGFLRKCDDALYNVGSEVPCLYDEDFQMDEGSAVYKLVDELNEAAEHVYCALSLIEALDAVEQKKFARINAIEGLRGDLT